MKAFARVFSFDLISKGVLGLISIALIRLMTASEYAKYTFSLAILAFVLQSISGTFNRMYILTPRRAVTSSGDAPTLLLLQLFVLYALTLLALPLSGRLGVLFFAVVALVSAACLYEFTRTNFQKALDFKSYSKMELQRAILLSSLILLAVVVFGKDTSAIAIVCAHTTAYLLICWRATAGRLKAMSLPSRAALLKSLRSLLVGGHQWLFAYFLLSGIFSQVDVFMLAALGDDVMVASYGSAFRYYGILALALSSAHALLLPMIQQTGTREELDELLLKHRRLLVGFSAAVFVVAWASGWFIPLIDAGKYPDAVPVLRILSVSIVISFAFSPHVNLILRCGQHRFLVLLMVCALFIALAGNYVLIPIHGAIGAALSTLVSAALVNVTIYLRSKVLLQHTYE